MKRALSLGAECAALLTNFDTVSRLGQLLAEPVVPATVASVHVENTVEVC